MRTGTKRARHEAEQHESLSVLCGLYTLEVRLVLRGAKYIDLVRSMCKPADAPKSVASWGRVDKGIQGLTLPQDG